MYSGPLRSLMNRRRAPPVSSRKVLTRDRSTSFDALPLTDPVIGVTTKSLISSATCADAAGIWTALAASTKHPARIVLCIKPLYLSANTQTTPPSGTWGNVPGMILLNSDCMVRESMPQPDCTATYCLPSTRNDTGWPMMPELVGYCHSTAPFVASNARNSRSCVPPLNPSPPPVASVGPQFDVIPRLRVQTLAPVSTFHACTSPM